jgi:hypothetical protein
MAAAAAAAAAVNRNFSINMLFFVKRRFLLFERQ